MKQLHAARTAMEAHLVRGLLAAEGIQCEVRGEHLTSGWGELPGDVCGVWVTAEHYERAHAVLVEYLQGSRQHEYADRAWTCAACGEAIEGQFAACWKCGKSHP